MARKPLHSDPQPVKQKPADRGTAEASLGASDTNAGGVKPPSSSDAGDEYLGKTFGKYRITKRLGNGGMAVVYQADDLVMKRPVAVKFLSSMFLHKPAAIERFMREAQVAGRLNHPNIIAIHDVSREERECYIVMELLSPGSAGQHLKQRGPYYWVVATRIIADCCAALKVAHDAGIIHRDIKPDNILFTSAGAVKLTDFGIVKTIEDDPELTASGQLVGTPLYMSPEQSTGSRDVDVRSDIYSLGASYYALLTGRPPFSGGNVLEILVNLRTTAPVDPREYVPEIPEACVKVIKRTLSKKPERRYQSAAELLIELESILDSMPRRQQSIFQMESALPQPRLVGESQVQAQGATLDGANVRPGTLERALDESIPGQYRTVSFSRRNFLLGGALAITGVGAGGYLALRSRLSSVSVQPGSKNPTSPTPQSQPLAARKTPLRVGILHSLSGPLAVSERPLADASMLAVEELNTAGGLLGRPIEAIVLDGKSEVTTDSAFARAANRLLTEDKVAAVFGGFGSGGRKAIKPFFEQHNGLLFYPASYEGLEESPNIIYTGATPNQFVLPALHWFAKQAGIKRIFLVGTDGLRPRAIEALVEEEIRKQSWKLIESYFAVVGDFEYSAVIKRIKKSQPQLILNVLVGDSSVAFLKQLREAEILRKDIPTLSFTIGEAEMAQLSSIDLSGHYIARAHFPLVQAGNESGFVSRFKAKFGAHRVVSETMEAAYCGVHLWAAAVRQAKSESVREVLTALKQKEYEIHGVKVRVDPSNQHTWKSFELGKLGAQNQMEIVPTDHEVLPPIPFPGSRTRAEWNVFLDSLFTRWDHNWANPHKPSHLRGK